MAMLGRSPVSPVSLQPVAEKGTTSMIGIARVKSRWSDSCSGFDMQPSSGGRLERSVPIAGVEGIQVRMLGPFEVTVGGRPADAITGRLRALLAMLAMSAGRTVSVDRLTSGLWRDALPSNVRRSVQTYIARLRSLLGADSISTKPAGYALETLPDQVDVLRFERLLDDVQSAATDPEFARTRIAEALALWRGAPFEGVDS